MIRCMAILLKLNVHDRGLSAKVIGSEGRGMPSDSARDRQHHDTGRCHAGTSWTDLYDSSFGSWGASPRWRSRGYGDVGEAFDQGEEDGAALGEGRIDVCLLRGDDAST
jgi:hypothetical protein